MQSTHPAWCIFTLRRVLADEKWLVLRTSIGCINKREGSQATRDDSGKGISIHLSQRLHLLAGFATNPSHRNCIWDKCPRGVRGDIFFGQNGVPGVSTPATINARGLTGRFSWFHQSDPRNTNTSACATVRGGSSWHHKGLQGLLCRSPPFTRIPFVMQWAHVWCKYYAATMRHLMIIKVCINWSRLDGDGANGCSMEMKSIISRVYYRPECPIPGWLPTQIREL